MTIFLRLLEVQDKALALREVISTPDARFFM